jgi:cobalt-zinc-cadmium efflux system membrane fusion protein
MYVRVLIHSQNQSVGMLAPVSAVLRNEENLPFVYLSQADGSFQRARIVLGARVDDRYEITSGLKDGDQIVIEGGLFVQFLQDQ